MTVRHVVPSAAGLTHASSVIALVRSSEPAAGTVTQLDVPLKVSAAPNLPAVVHVVFVTVPLFPAPDESATVVLAPSLKPYAATRPGGGPVLPTVTDTAADVPVLFDVSRATA